MGRLDALDERMTQINRQQNAGAWLVTVAVLAVVMALCVGLVSGQGVMAPQQNLPTAAQKAALAGTAGTVSASNAYVTSQDTRILSQSQKNALTGGADTTLHYHAADRARAVHTGTQTRSTISDFAHQGTHRIGGADALPAASYTTYGITEFAANGTASADKAVVATDGRLLSSSANRNLLEGGLDVTLLHWHSLDRARANHTGTQFRNTISDFAHQGTHRIGGPDALPAGSTTTYGLLPLAVDGAATAGAAVAASDGRMLTSSGTRAALEAGADTTLHYHLADRLAVFGEGAVLKEPHAQTVTFTGPAIAGIVGDGNGSVTVTIIGTSPAGTMIGYGTTNSIPIFTGTTAVADSGLSIVGDQFNLNAKRIYGLSGLEIPSGIAPVNPRDLMDVGGILAYQVTTGQTEVLAYVSQIPTGVITATTSTLDLGGRALVNFGRLALPSGISPANDGDLTMNNGMLEYNSAGVVRQVAFHSVTPGGPGIRSGARMVYDPNRKRALLFGGVDTGGKIDETWEWSGAAWEWLSPSSAPDARAYPGLAYDRSRSNAVLFGGAGAVAALGDTWTWDGTNWTEKAPATSPPACWGSGMVYDSARNETVLFGGATDAIGDNTITATWTWNGTNWTEKAPATQPARRFGCAMAFDEDRGVVVLFGGSADTTSATSDTWEWDGTNWTEISPSNPPTARRLAAATFSPDQNAVMLFGGFEEGTSTYPADTYTYNGAAWVATATTGISPSGRQGAAMSLIDMSGCVSIFGGLNAGATVNDFWKFGPNAHWSQ